MSQNIDEQLPAIISLVSRIEILENLFNNLNENFSAIQSITRKLKSENQDHCNSTEIEEAIKENAGLRERIGILGQCIDLQSQNQQDNKNVLIRIDDINNQVIHLEEGLYKLIERVEKLELDNSDYDERITDLENIEFESRLLKLESDHLGVKLDPKVWKFLNEKVVELENHIRSINNTYPVINDHANRIKKLEDNSFFNRDNRDDLNKVVIALQNDYDKRFEDLQTQLETVRALGSRAYHPKKPYKCPTCEGMGKITLKKLSDGRPLIVQDCESCEGKGIVWG